MPAEYEQPRYRVTARLVIVPVADQWGRRMVHLGQHAPLPAGVDPERIAHLLRKQMIELVPDAVR